MRLGEVVHVSVYHGGPHAGVACRPALVWGAEDGEGRLPVLTFVARGDAVLGYVRALARGEPGVAGTWHSGGEGCGA